MFRLSIAGEHLHNLKKTLNCDAEFTKNLLCAYANFISPLRRPVSGHFSSSDSFSVMQHALARGLASNPD